MNKELRISVERAAVPDLMTELVEKVNCICIVDFRGRTGIDLEIITRDVAMILRIHEAQLNPSSWMLKCN